MAYFSVSLLSAALAALLMLNTYEIAYSLESTAVTNLISLYVELHKFVLPVPDQGSFGDDTAVTKRFIQRSAGMVMYPDEYMSDLDEKLFYLSEEVPSMNPLFGAIADKSFVKQYQEALENIRVRDLGDITENKRDMYITANEVLKQPRVSPTDKTLNVSLLEVYNHYESVYREKLNQAALPAYEIDAAYKDWVVLGEKALVEYHMKYINVLPSGEGLQVARDELDTDIILLEDGVTAIYPIAFEPATWTSYIDNENLEVSKDILFSRIALLKAKEFLLTDLSAPGEDSDFNAYLTSLQATSSATESDLIQKIDSMKSSWSDCRAGLTETFVPTACSDLDETEVALLQQLNLVSRAYTSEETADNHIDSPDIGLDEAIAGIVAERESLESQLDSTETKLPPYLERIMGSWDLTEKEHEDGWSVFSFDSYGQLASSQSPSYSTAYEYGVRGGLWDGTGKLQYSSKDSLLTMLLNEAYSVSVHAKILPVAMDRKWFHPSLFSSADLTLADANAAVSPGFLSETQFFAASTSQTPTYSFPSYQSTLIFAKDVVLEFTGMNAADAEAALQFCSDPYVSARYGPFTIFGALDSDSFMQASAVPAGVQIVLPGMQLIGYVTDIVPKLPYI